MQQQLFVPVKSWHHIYSWYFTCFCFFAEVTPFTERTSTTTTSSTACICHKNHPVRSTSNDETSTGFKTSRLRLNAQLLIRCCHLPVKKHYERRLWLNSSPLGCAAVKGKWSTPTCMATSQAKRWNRDSRSAAEVTHFKINILASGEVR